VAELKTKATKASVKGFIDKIPDEQTREDCFAIAKIMQEVTGCEPQMWGTTIVGFDVYRYKYGSSHEGEWPLTGFSPRKQNLTLYIMTGFDAYDELMQKLGKHTTGKSCLYIKRLSDVHIPTLKKLISKSVKYMKKNYQ
jgi:hypothetical protein